MTRISILFIFFFKIMHDFLQEIYFDFCLKNDMPKHPESSPFNGYLSADDLLSSNYQFTKSQVYWLKNYVRLWALSIIHGSISQKRRVSKCIYNQQKNKVLSKAINQDTDFLN